jgi:hypothetical protein
MEVLTPRSGDECSVNVLPRRSNLDILNPNIQTIDPRPSTLKLFFIPKPKA